MAHVIKLAKAADVNRAGGLLRIGQASITATEWDWALGCVNDWRAAHSYPLNAIAMTLRNRAKRCDPNAVIARRLKRLPSIENKLRRFQTMRLSQIQDIGGCRAVVSSMASVHAIIAAYDISDGKNPNRHRRLTTADYISTPKPDGYRSMHLIYEYRSHHSATATYDGLRIEIQIRSLLQHAWATAVETIDTFSSQSIKSGVGQDDWRRFLLCVSSAFAVKEGTPPVPNTPADHGQLADEILDLEKRLKVFTTLSAWRAAIQHVTKIVKPASHYLLYLDIRPGFEKLTITPFANSDAANEEYRRLEDQTHNDFERDVVLVSVDSASKILDAYPNYYADTALFTNELIEALRLLTG
jgi:ppGpp synthetase/RelA/SpoT-type nucleotidyltranferase